jgi:hypothetical protein
VTDHATHDAARKRFRVIAIALFVSMFLLAATASWGFGNGNMILGGILAVTAALEGAAAVYFWMKSN